MGDYTPIMSCSICLDVFAEKCVPTKLPCEHKFHTGCVKQLRQAKCPLCRKDFGIDSGLKKDEIDMIKSREADDKKEREVELPEMSDVDFFQRMFNFMMMMETCECEPCKTRRRLEEQGYSSGDIIQILAQMYE